MTVTNVDGEISFTTSKELRIPVGIHFEVDTNTIFNIPKGMVMIIISNKYTALHYGINVMPSPLIISSDETGKNLTIPVIWDGINRYRTEIDLRGCVKIPANTCIARAIFVNISQYCYMANTNEE